MPSKDSLDMVIGQSPGTCLPTISLLAAVDKCVLCGLPSYFLRRNYRMLWLSFLIKLKKRGNSMEIIFWCPS